jgi:hypothetical protein
MSALLVASQDISNKDTTNLMPTKDIFGTTLTYTRMFRFTMGLCMCSLVRLR